MKGIGKRLTIALASGLLHWASPPVHAQDIHLQGLHGEALRESDLHAQPTLVVVWASWSPRGQDIDQRVNALADRWGGQWRVITVNFQEDRETAQAFLADRDLRAPVYLDADGAFSKKHAVTNLPGLLVFRNGETLFGNRLPDAPDRVLEALSN